MCIYIYIYIYIYIKSSISKNDANLRQLSRNKTCIYIYIKKFKSTLKANLQVTEMLNIVFAKFTWSVFRSPAFYLTFKNLK